jgi:hypothetical protein
VKPEVGSPRKIKSAQIVGARVATKKWGQSKLTPQNNKDKLVNKRPPIKKAKQYLSKVKCFDCDNNGQLVKDYPKPPWVSALPKVN